MSNVDFPKVFRPMQIETFLNKAREANAVPGPDNETFHDSHIEMVLEEVQANEADLTAARVSIEIYLNTEINKDPDNPIFHRLLDGFRPIFEEVKQIEIKQFGAPRVMVSNENNNATAWRMDGAQEITQVQLPQDVLTEAAKYNFTSIQAADFQLPEQPETVDDVRRKFFNELPKDEDSSVDRERDWLKNFEKEASYELIDRALFICNFHDQVSLQVIKQLRIYGLAPKRSKEMLAYESGCQVPEPETAPCEFIVTASNASKRALFTMLHLTGEKRDDFQLFIDDQVDYIRKEGDYPADDYEMDSDIEQAYPLQFVKDKGFSSMVDSLLKMYGKLPIFEEDLLGFKLVFKFLLDDAPNVLSHYYVAFNDMISYYEERGFHETATNCTLLKEFIADLMPQEAEPTEAEVQESNDAAQEQRAKTASTGVYIE